MRFLLQGLGIFLVLVGVAAGPVAAADPLAERALGNADAPVTIIEYSSLTCPHCAEFHRETMPRVKATYIDTGKVRLVYRDFPIGALAMAAAMVAHCLDPTSYFGFIDVLYRDQASWAGGNDPLANLKRYARLAGLSDAGFDACLKNQQLLDGIRDRALKAQNQHGIDSTPSFLINGEKAIGAMDYESFQKIIDQALAKTR